VSNWHARSLVAVLAAVLAAIAWVTSAFAATSWTVRPGGPISMKSGTYTLKDTLTGTTIICASSSLSGTIKSGSGHSGTGIGSIATVSISYCGNLGMYTLTPGDLPWHLNTKSYNPATGVVTGSLSHIHLTLAAPNCHAGIDGTSGGASDGIVTFTYANSTAKLKALTTGGNLHFYNVHGCAGLVRNSDPATVSATFPVAPKQAITSP
jgi:hypothetical protein